MSGLAMPSISLLHFTDLHIGMKELPADWPTIEFRLFEDLEHVHSLSGPWDLLLFTGDLAFSGRHDEFERVQGFLERLWERFRELGCDPKLLVVPGNHDLAWPPEDFVTKLRRGWREVGFRRDFWTDDNSGNRGLVREAFAAYEAWWSELCREQANGGAVRIPVLLPTTSGVLPGDFSATFEKSGVALGLLGLNTTFLQLRKGMRRGSLAVDKYQFQEASEHDLPKWVKRHDACLLMTHHPPAWLSVATREDLHAHVVDVARPALHLYGHMHRSEQSQSSHNGGPSERQLQGASLFGVERWGTRWEQRIHGYSACKLEFKGDKTILRIWPRRMVRLPEVGFRLRPDQDYDPASGSEEIEPIVISRHRGARDLSPWRSQAAVELGEMGLHVWRPEDRGQQRAREFARLTRKLDEWLMEEPRKHGSPRVRVLWLVGEDVPHRADSMHACLTHASATGHTVADAGRDPSLAGRGVEWCLRHPPASPPLIGVELDASQSQQVWIDSRNALLAARNAVCVPEHEYARLIVAGEEEQAEAAARALEVLAEMITVDSKGRPKGRPGISFSGIVRSSEHVFDRGLPMTARKLFGRARDLQRLRDAWSSKTIRVVPVVAFGGTGKSALVNEWLREMDETGYDEAGRVLAWSFYSQGTRENLVSADEFVNYAREWLGDDEEVTLSPWAKGDKLASLIKRQGRFLLVLDGMEPLQHPLDSPEELGGRLTDDSLRALLEGLASDDWEGLCVVTTRVELTDLAPFETTRSGDPATVELLPLGNLDDRQGAELLEHLIGREADFQELQEAVQGVGGHALALTLLGNYIRDVHGGDLAGRFDLEELSEDKREGEHARRVMASYARWLAEQKRTAELAILNLIGLFDRPAEPSAMSALLGDSDLSPLTAGLDRVGGVAWNQAVATLQKMGLLNEDAPESPGMLDAHPLVREHSAMSCADSGRCGSRVTASSSTTTASSRRITSRPSRSGWERCTQRSPTAAPPICISGCSTRCCSSAYGAAAGSTSRRDALASRAAIWSPCRTTSSIAGGPSCASWR
jgi:calcineurin-like phosphoesterase family protein